MHFIIKRKWFVLIAWIVVVAGLFVIAPNMAGVVREKGELEIPKQYSSTLANEILDGMKKQGTNEWQSALVFYDANGLTDEEVTEAKKAIRTLEANKEQLGITELVTHFNDEELKDQLVSKDGKAILASVSMSPNNRERSEVSDELYDAIKGAKVEHYFTGNWMINEDLIKSSEEGLKKTEGITVAFILIVLLLVFRSAVAPLIPLLAVGVSYLASQSIVAMLADRLDFPVSTYTQIFLVAVLFGIGTDYCILLLSRLKEELARNDNTAAAIVETYRNAGRTVLFSGLAVMVGFSAIGFSQFKLYQSAAAVAVGVAALLLALFTIVPFFMALFGKRMFWPSKSIAEHHDSKIWGLAGKFSLTRPLLALLTVAIVCVPFLLTYDGDTSYNSLEEIGSDVPSIKAFNAIADSFGPGEAMPTKIVIKNDERMDSLEYMALAEKLSQEIEKIDGVEKVRSATRPLGEPMKDFKVSEQAKTLEEGLSEGIDGIDQISDGLHTAGSELAGSGPKLADATDGIGELITGTDQMKSGLEEIHSNLAMIENGIRSGSAGSAEVKKGLVAAKAGAERLAASHRQIAGGYRQIEDNLKNLNGKYVEVGKGLDAMANALAQIKQENFAYLEGRYDGLSQELAYQQLKGTVAAVQQQLPGLSAGVNQLNVGLTQITAAMTTANQGYEQAIGGQTELAAGLDRLIAGIEQQKAGLDKLADGQGQIVSSMPKLTDGLTDINGGQKQLLDGFADLGGQLDQLVDGLNQSTDGLNQISDGLSSAREYLTGLSDTEGLNGFYLPKEALESEEFKPVLDTYLSEDRKVMTLDVVGASNPYSNEAIDQVNEIKETVARATKDTKLENATIAVGGISSMNADLDTMSRGDYSRTVVLMLIGISIILIFLFRSLIMPVYLIGSLILTYYTSMAINEAIFINILGYSGISWAVPFFGFVILVALGVDYSIFLMDRFSEYRELSIADAMLESMKKMGTVIISAAVILGGTFAAMMPSGMLSLLQIASIVLVGLLLYALIVLPLFIPVLVKNFGQANWWPFKRETN